MGSFRVVPGPLGPSVGLLGVVCGRLDRLWGRLGSFGVVCGIVLGHSASFKGRLRSSVTSFGVVWGRLESSVRSFGVVWGCLWGRLGSFGVV